jgi:D-galactarolactone cycloisomerase
VLFPFSHSRRELLQSLFRFGAAGSAAHCLAGVAAAAPRDVTAMRITGYELLPVKIPMAAKLREAWNQSWSQQKRDQTYFSPIFVKLHSDAGLTGIGEAKTGRDKAEAVLKKMMGRSPWEFAHDDDIAGILIAIYDLVGKATGLPVARLLSAHPKDRIVQTWWSQCFPPALMASEAKLGAELGYRVHKIKIRPWQDPIEQVSAISAFVPKDFKIWADANAWWGVNNQWQDKSSWAGVDGALHVIRKLAE